MKLRSPFSLALMLIGISSWSHAAELVEIECSLTPIDRATIHPSGDYAAVQYSTPSQSSSTNWSGYVAAADLSGTSGNGTVTYVAGSWVVPKLLPTTDGTYCAIWVGIDGYTSDTVEQIGTSQNWLNGAQQNYAWFEMYPNGSYEITGFPVDDGDVISARVAYKGNNTFALVIVNQTKGVSTTIPSSYTMSTSAARSCAEWVVEAPYSNMVLPLSDFKLATFNYCSAVINNIHGVINSGSWMCDEITMASTVGVEALPSALLKNGTCFQVTWKNQ